MCERVKKAKSALSRYRRKADSIYQVADNIQKQIQVLEEQILILKIAHLAASEVCCADFDQHHEMREADRKLTRAVKKTASRKTSAAKAPDPANASPSEYLMPWLNNGSKKSNTRKRRQKETV